MQVFTVRVKSVTALEFGARGDRNVGRLNQDACFQTTIARKRLRGRGGPTPQNDSFNL